MRHELVLHTVTQTHTQIHTWTYPRRKRLIEVGWEMSWFSTLTYRVYVIDKYEHKRLQMHSHE